MEGGCACGGVRYRLEAQPFDAGYCHCRNCQLASGAPVLAYATVPLGAYVVTRGRPRTRRSSEFGQRSFCADCGTALTMQVDHQPETIDFTLATLDQPASAKPPGFHLWTASRIAWFDVRDDLPRHDGFRPDTRGL